MYIYIYIYVTYPFSLAGLEFFCTTIETPEGDVPLLQTAMTAIYMQRYCRCVDVHIYRCACIYKYT